MKISNKQKQENRRAILDAAVELIIEKGVRGASMRAIARAAGVGDATIYNYFPTKEALLYGYYSDSLEDAAQALEQVGGVEEFDLREKMQTLFELILEGYLGDREFVAETFPSVFFHPIPLDKGIRSIRSRFIELVSEQFRAAEESGELPEVLLKELVCHFIWDFFIASVLYWIKDDSEQFSNTTIFIDKSMDLGYTMLKSGVLDKVTGLASFLFKSHVLSRVDMFMEQRNAFQRIKQEFMDYDDER